jgi:hypothetical protein
MAGRKGFIPELFGKYFEVVIDTRYLVLVYKERFYFFIYRPYISVVCVNLYLDLSIQQPNQHRPGG